MFENLLGKFIKSDFIKSKAKVIEVTESTITVQYVNAKIRKFFINSFKTHNYVVLSN